MKPGKLVKNALVAVILIGFLLLSLAFGMADTFYLEKDIPLSTDSVTARG